MKKLPIVAIVGRANVGKSSLFNAILARREAIVAIEAGTTRDSIMSKASWRGQDFWLVDTAGMKSPEDDFEFTIQEQILQAADSADVIWVVVEANVPMTDEDRRVAKLALKSRKPVFLVINKIDKARGETDNFERLGHQADVSNQHHAAAGGLKLCSTVWPRLCRKPRSTKPTTACTSRSSAGRTSANPSSSIRSPKNSRRL